MLFVYLVIVLVQFHTLCKHLAFLSSRKFQIRITRSTLEGRLDGQVVNSLGQERLPLGSLKAQGQRVSVNRSGPALVGPAGRCQQEVAPKLNNGPAFSILQVSTSIPK